jgi:hypothetical protein
MLMLATVFALEAFAVSSSLPVPAFAYIMLVFTCGAMALFNSKEARWRRVGWGVALAVSTGLLLYRAHDTLLIETHRLFSNIVLVLVTVAGYNLLVYISGFLRDEWYEVSDGWEEVTFSEDKKSLPATMQRLFPARVERNVTEDLIHVKKRLWLPLEMTWRAWVYLVLQVVTLGVVSVYLFI